MGRSDSSFFVFPICSICPILPSYLRTLLVWGPGEEEGVAVLRSPYLAQLQCSWTCWELCSILFGESLPGSPPDSTASNLSSTALLEVVLVC